MRYLWVLFHIASVVTESWFALPCTGMATQAPIVCLECAAAAVARTDIVNIPAACVFAQPVGMDVRAIGARAQPGAPDTASATS